MNIGIVIHSRTGNTLSIAQKVKEELISAGRLISIQKVSALNDAEADVGKIKLDETADVGMYDAVIFGASVRGLSLSPVMQAYLNGLGSLSGKQTACFVTQFLPYAWMGGHRAIRQMCEICQRKGSVPFGTGIVNWSKATIRDKQIEAMAGKLCAALELSLQHMNSPLS